jgi:hypothetical protein
MRGPPETRRWGAVHEVTPGGVIKRLWSPAESSCPKGFRHVGTSVYFFSPKSASLKILRKKKRKEKKREITRP